MSLVARIGASLVVALGCSFGAAASAWAGPPSSLDSRPSAPAIAYGEAVEPCAWPTTVAVLGGGQCTGTLIHPRVVVYAAHCGGGAKTIRFGEDALAGGRTVQTESCAINPAYLGADDQGLDWAYCVLSEAVDELPLTPPLFGCELAALELGAEVALVGFGETDAGVFNLKHWASTTLVAVTPSNNTTLVGAASPDGTPSICPGDSGGPSFMQLADGSWRTLGVASTVVGECGGYGAHAILAGAVAWIEAEANIDVTPCHAADGSWAPSPACVGANASAPGLGSGSWADWCAGTAASGPGTSCGPAWDELDPGALATVAITSPSDGEFFLDGARVDVEVEALRDPTGPAVARVRLEVDGAQLLGDDNDPWLFEAVELAGPAVHTLVAIAEDWAGNEVASAPVRVGLGVEVPDEGTGDTTADTGEGPSAEDGSGGCGCATSTSTSRPALPLLAIVSLIALIRRRRIEPQEPGFGRCRVIVND